MRTRTKTATIALTGAVALASGAYALGTQAGGGSADAADPQRPNVPTFQQIRGGLPREPFGLDSLADRLGVDENDLEDALKDARPQLPDPKDVRRDFSEELANELGISKDRVDDALERMQDNAEQEFEQRRNELAEQLADRLNLDVDEVKEALEDQPFLGFGGPLRLRHP
jgi:energy-converting hydrogenase A subunit M